MTVEYESTRRRIRELRAARGLSQMELSRRTGIHPACISQLEHGHIRCWPGYVKKIAEALGVSVEELRGEAA